MKKIGIVLTIVSLFSNNIYPLDNIENLTPLTTEAYFLDVFNHINALQSRLTLANKLLPTEVIGTEVIEGYISGTLTYEAKFHGAGVKVTITYDNFCDEEGWIFDGQIISNAKVVGKGNYEGEITIKGYNPCKIIYSDVKSKLGYITEGTFDLVLEGQEAKQIDLQHALSTSL